jgi:hypothetical protein
MKHQCKFYGMTQYIDGSIAKIEVDKQLAMVLGPSE